MTEKIISPEEAARRAALLRGATEHALNQPAMPTKEQIETQRKEAERLEKERLAALQRQRDLEEGEKKWVQQERGQRNRRAGVVAGIGVSPEANAVGSSREDWDPNKGK